MNEALTSAVVAAMVSGVFGIYLGLSDRRKIRGEVLESIYGIELLRWADSSHEDFMRGIRKLRAKALVARADKDKIETYVYLAAVSRRVSENDLDDTPDAHKDYGGAIPSELNTITKNAAELNIEALWSPLKSKIFGREKLKDLKIEIEKYKKKVEKKNLKYPDLSPLKIDWNMKI